MAHIGCIAAQNYKALVTKRQLYAMVLLMLIIVRWRTCRVVA